MLNTKLLASILLVLAVMFAQVGNVAAAPQTQDTTPTITQIDPPVTDENGVTTVLVTLLLEDQTTQTVRISLAYALDLGLLDPTTQQPVPLENVPDGTIIDPNEVIPDEEPAEEDVHPIVWLLAEFFGEEPSVVEGYHEDGFGFGVIAQALWMSQNLTGTEDMTGDASLAEDILNAKQDKNYETFFEAHPEYLDDTGSIPTNWGQFKKAILEKKNNLGVVVSGQENQDDSTDSLSQQDHGNGKDKKKDKGNGRNKNP